MLTVHIVVLTDLAQYATYSHAIKVTVDGPREPRSKLGVEIQWQTRYSIHTAVFVIGALTHRC